MISVLIKKSRFFNPDVFPYFMPKYFQADSDTAAGVQHETNRLKNIDNI